MIEADGVDKTEFISESHCLYKDAKIVWRGTINGDTLKGVSSWTVKRWYWTIERNLIFEGTITAHTTAIPVVSSAN